MEGLRSDRAKEVEDDAETERVIGLVMTAIEDDLRGVSKAIISKRDDELLGPGEFDLREAAARIALGVAATQGSSSGGRKKSSALSARSR